MKVYHAIRVDPTDREVAFAIGFSANAAIIKELFGSGKIRYEHVANIAEDGDDDAGNELEAAFIATNTIDSPWYRGNAISLVGPRRSTSVGDIIELRGKFYVVMSIGFEEIGIKL